MYKKLLILFALSMSSSFGADKLGYFVSHKKLISSYKVVKEEALVEDFTDYIQKHAKNLSFKEANLIAEDIILSANCFEIEPRIFLALVRLESNFKKQAISHTGAVGLTQFTSIAGKEVSDQLGRRGGDYANPLNTLYLRAKVKSCIDEQWTDLWARTGSDSWRVNKKLFLTDTRLALTYGAILMKVYLATNFRDDSLEDTYFDALKTYNGEPGERKFWYARKVLSYFKKMKF